MPPCGRLAKSVTCVSVSVCDRCDVCSVCVSKSLMSCQCVNLVGQYMQSLGSLFCHRHSHHHLYNAASLSARSFPFTPACPEQYTHRSFRRWMSTIDTCQSGIPRLVDSRRPSRPKIIARRNAELKLVLVTHTTHTHPLIEPKRQ